MGPNNLERLCAVICITMTPATKKYTNRAAILNAPLLGITFELDITIAMSNIKQKSNNSVRFFPNPTKIIGKIKKNATPAVNRMANPMPIKANNVPQSQCES